MDDRIAVGHAAEQAVAKELETRGYFILDLNARDRRGELDIVVRRGREIVAVEVRSRRNSDCCAAADSVGRKKRRQVRQTMERWLAQKPEDYDEVRFFVAAVNWRDEVPEIRIYEDAF